MDPEQAFLYDNTDMTLGALAHINIMDNSSKLSTIGHAIAHVGFLRLEESRSDMGARAWTNMVFKMVTTSPEVYRLPHKFFSVPDNYPECYFE